MIFLDFEYSFEKLSDTIDICVTKDHKFGTDAFLLSDFAGVQKNHKAVDFGTGCGIIAMLWFRFGSGPKEAYCVDIQEKAIEQLKITIEHCKLQDRVTPVLGDIKDIKQLLPAEYFDVVTCNPPYKANKAGIISEMPSEKIARHETMCNIDDVCKAACRVLKFGGRLCICQRPERLADVLEAMRRNNVEPKRVRFVQQHGDTTPWLFLAEGKKGSKRFMKVEKPLIMKNGDEYSEEILRIYGKLQQK
ncbi:MAG: methyltransferase domain-containing protein [Eubacteriales bacterium]|nr:methyltransferase domain-containing protein [Eubacteriales bacterium]